MSFGKRTYNFQDQDCVLFHVVNYTLSSESRIAKRQTFLPTHNFSVYFRDN
jgi:hypothetical protein